MIACGHAPELEGRNRVGSMLVLSGERKSRIRKATTALLPSLPGQQDRVLLVVTQIPI
jgi:hypothetical protein